MSGSSLTKKEKCFVFKARSQTLDVKCNFKLGQSNLECRLCNTHPENQESLLTCPALVTEKDLPASQQPPAELYIVYIPSVEISVKKCIQ